MQGELGTSHCYELGGDYRPLETWHQGMLGADLRYDAKTKSWKIARIPAGDSWIEGARSPLAAPGLDLREGDELLAVNGREVGADRSPHACLVNLADSDVTLRVRRGRKGAPREIAVHTLPVEFDLRYRDWVEANRARVHKESKGRVGYLHIPDMAPRGYAEFHRYFHQEMDRDGLIIDVRWNGGGHVSQLLLEKLARKRVGYDQSRWMGAVPYPSEAPMGPMVALTNEYAGSDGDIFSHCFKLYGLGPLIGMRTWGGVVGVWPRHALVDGTVTTQPEFSYWFHDVGWNVENYGTDPDIEIDIRPQDAAAGLDPQLDRALAEVLKIIKKDKPSIPKFDRRPKLTPPRLKKPD
jgi:tricorn protease